jgi:hypothetical protein
VNAKDAASGAGATQFGRALTELNIDILCANSPQAKGRVERAFGTLQDRLVKELRLAGISTVEAANAWLPGFVEDYNKRFSRAPANVKNLHRRLTEADDPDEILAWREERTVTRDLTLRYDRRMLLLEPTPFARELAGKKVEVVNYPDGRLRPHRRHGHEAAWSSRCSAILPCAPATTWHYPEKRVALLGEESVSGSPAAPPPG